MQMSRVYQFKNRDSNKSILNIFTVKLKGFSDFVVISYCGGAVYKLGSALTFSSSSFCRKISKSESCCPKVDNK